MKTVVQSLQKEGVIKEIVRKRPGTGRLSERGVELYRSMIPNSWKGSKGGIAKERGGAIESIVASTGGLTSVAEVSVYWVGRLESCHIIKVVKINDCGADCLSSGLAGSGE